MQPTTTKADDAVAAWHKTQQAAPRKLSSPLLLLTLVFSGMACVGTIAVMVRVYDEQHRLASPASPALHAPSIPGVVLGATRPKIFLAQASWSDCWSSDAIGAKLDAGTFHGCMTYTHTAGTRGRYLDFSYGILSANKPAGILTRLGSDGKPIIDPTSDLSGKKIVDVSGWAPTADGLSLVTNWCTGERYTGYTVLTPTDSEGNAIDGNDAAMTMLRNGEADGMFVYADQAYNYRPNQTDVTPTWDTNLWSGLGTRFAYIGTGMLGHSYNGTTLAISKKGSGLNDILNPCIQKYMESAAYLDTCKKHALEASCYPNAHFPANPSNANKPWMKKTNEQPVGGCANGYCECAAGASTGADNLLG